MNRTLSLRSETLTDLTPDQLVAVAGGALATTPVRECYGDLFTHYSALDCLTNFCGE